MATLRPASTMPDDWHRMILAPLLRLESKATHRLSSRMLLLNIIRSHRLLDEGPGGRPVREILAELGADTASLDTFTDKLAGVISKLPPDEARAIGTALYDCSLAIAQATPGASMRGSIEDAESEELRRLLIVFGLSKDSRSGDSPLPASIKEPLHRIAARLDEDFYERAFELLCAMHDVHESEWARGAGKLHGIERIEDIPWPTDHPWVDSGVLVMPGGSGKTHWIVGDLHGDYESLCRILQRTGFDTNSPSPDHHLVFIGDIGDRGAGTLAVWLKIAELKTSFPNQVFVLRGNHEELQPVRLHRDGAVEPMKQEWFVPTTTNFESYFSLANVLLHKLGNLEMVYAHLPDVLLLEGGVMIVHGSLPPRWQENDGWTMAENAKEGLKIASLADLRKPEVRKAIRWTDLLGDREDVSHAWAGHFQGKRLFAAKADLHHWRDILGSFRMIHGHTHPSEGARSECDGMALALNSSRHTSPRQAIAKVANGNWEWFVL